MEYFIKSYVHIHYVDHCVKVASKGLEICGNFHTWNVTLATK